MKTECIQNVYRKNEHFECPSIRRRGIKRCQSRTHRREVRIVKNDQKREGTFTLNICKSDFEQLADGNYDSVDICCDGSKVTYHNAEALLAELDDLGEDYKNQFKSLKRTADGIFFYAPLISSILAWLIVLFK